jgi:diguanylate cyclase (GGDEF)-like protein
LAFATAGLALFAAWQLWHFKDPNLPGPVTNIAAVPFSMFATACAVGAALRTDGGRRVGWLCMAVGFSGWVIGDVSLAYYAVAGKEPPFPSIVDYTYLLLPLSVCVAAVFGPGRRRSGIRLLLEGVIVSASLFLVAWSIGLRRLYEISGLSGPPFAMSVAYLVVNLALITVLSVHLWRAPRGRRLSLGLLTAGMVVVGLTTSVFIYLLTFGPFDDDAVMLCWVFAMYLLGAGGLAYQPEAVVVVGPPRRPSQVALWLPYLPVPVAVVFGAIDLWQVAKVGPILIAGLVLILAALFRQFTLLDENRRLRVTVADIALRDPLTGLANRALFTDRLTHAMQLRLRRAAPVAVLLLNLDDFKLVNDSLGHAAGDSLLCAVGDRVQGGVRTGDTVARLGGDEFAVLIEDDPDVARTIAERVVRVFDDAFVVGDRKMFIRPSVGMAVAESDDSADITADDLFTRADLAMYSAKRDQFSGVRTFTDGMRLDATEVLLSQHQNKPGQRDGIARIELLRDLRRAIDDDLLTLVYQPKFNLCTGAVAGVEALVRWPHPELGTLAPADFLPLVRQHGLMDAVTNLVIEKAIGDAAGWYQAGIVLPVAINLFAPSLNDEGLPDHILSVLAEYGLPTNALCVEITEDLLLASIDRARTVLDRLRGFGIRIAIDDFGSGYAAMTYLRELPIDEIKLDRQFVAPILRDPRAAAIVQSVIELAETCGISSVAEGVEDKATADRLKEYGCGYVQGHYFSPPVPAEAVRLGVWGSALVDARITRAATTRPSSA